MAKQSTASTRPTDPLAAVPESERPDVRLARVPHHQRSR